MNKIFKYVIIDIIRNRIMIAYTIFLSIISFSILGLEDSNSKGLLSLLNLILLALPLVSIIFSTIYLYNASEFIELLLSQPIKRERIWKSLFGGLAFALSLAYLIGVGVPILIFEMSFTGCVFILMGILLSIIFVSLSLLSVSITRDRAKGIGLSILLWLFFTLMYDGLVLFLLFQLSEYPLDNVMIILSCFNPIDLARIFILLQLDISALMGYTGAVFQQFFGTSLGIIATTIILFLWIIIPFAISTHIFKSKDL